MHGTSDRIISAPIGDFCQMSGIGRSLVYEMIADGRLESIKIGKRRLVLIDSYRRLIEACRGASAEQPAPNAPRTSRQTKSVRTTPGAAEAAA
jgi:excisionase family DNA binding protein